MLNVPILWQQDIIRNCAVVVRSYFPKSGSKVISLMHVNASNYSESAFPIEILNI